MVLVNGLAHLIKDVRRLLAVIDVESITLGALVLLVGALQARLEH